MTAVQGRPYQMTGIDLLKNNPLYQIQISIPNRKIKGKSLFIYDAPGISSRGLNQFINYPWVSVSVNIKIIASEKGHYPPVCTHNISVNLSWGEPYQ